MSFSDYYSVTPNLTVFNNSTRQSALPLYTFIHFCYFSFLWGSNGGAIYSANVPTRSYIENCMFFACRCEGKGGAVCIDNKNGAASVMNRVCANNCSSTGVANGQSLYIYTNITDINYLFSVSIAFCGIDQAPGYHSFTILGGNQIISKINSSFNSVRYQGTGITIWEANQSSVTYSNICGGISSQGNCYNVQPSTNTYYSRYCNIFNNSCQIAIVWSHNANAIFLDCVFLQNSDPLAVSHSGSIRIEKCWSDSYQFSVISGAVVFADTMSKTATYEIRHFHTYLCPTADYFFTMRSSIKNSFKLLIEVFNLFMTL